VLAEFDHRQALVGDEAVDLGRHRYLFHVNYVGRTDVITDAAARALLKLDLFDHLALRSEEDSVFWRSLLAFAMIILSAAVATAQDKLTLALGQRGNWDTAIAPLGEQAGIFKKHGLMLDILWTQGAGESQQAVLSGSVDIGLAGTIAALAAFAKGAPVRIIAAEATGGADYWYVRADSAIKSLADIGGKTIAYSTNGASTHTLVLAFMAKSGAAAKSVATGGPAPTFTQVMSGQIDVGWSAPPFGLDAAADNKIRIIARAGDVEAGRDQTIRSLITTAPKLAEKPDVFRRFVAAYRETIDWMYAGDAAIAPYAAFAGVSPAIARRTRDEFFPKAMLWPDKISGLDALMQDGVKFKYLAAPLTAAQLGEAIQIPGPN
jgi:ABC-type nitrate/sulfonate/bicarbonate transport system substrate-binding protein